MLPLRFFRNRGFAAGNGAIFFTFASLFSCVFLFAQFLQTSLGYDALETGLRLMPWTITFILVAPAAGALADRIGERPLMASGLAIAAVGLGWLALIADDGIAYSQLLGPFIVAGIGVSMAIPSGQNAVVRGISLAEVGKAAGANSMMRELGGVFGIAVVVAVFAGAGGYASAAAFADGFAAAVGVAAGPGGGRRGDRHRAARKRQDNQANGTARAGARGNEELKMIRVVARYRVKPDRVEENLKLVRDVYAEAAEARPEGLRYATFQLDDGVTFVHVSLDEGETEPLTRLDAFKRFLADLPDRCEEPPYVRRAEVVGSYGFEGIFEDT